MQLKTRGSSVKAFSLVELIMVVVVLGMMAIFVYPNYSKTITKSYEKTATNNLYTIYAAQRLLYNTSSSYAPDSVNVAAINTNLQLSIVDPNMDYECRSVEVAPPYTEYACQAAKTGGSFTLRVDQADPPVICCCPPANSCLTASLPSCAGGCF